MDNCIQNFDMLNYKPVQNKHEKSSRRPDHVLQLKLNAFGMVLQLVLKKDRSVFTTNHISELTNGSLINLDLSFLYSGMVMGMPHSYCHGSLIRGIFQGSIFLQSETYHVEKSFRIFKKYPGFHSVIYRESDIKCKEIFESSPNYVTNVTVKMS